MLLKDMTLEWMVEEEYKWGGSADAARIWEIPAGSWSKNKSRLLKEVEATGVDYEIAELPESDLTIEQMLEAKAERFERKQENRDAKEWRRIEFNDVSSIGIMFFGDPHIDDDGCNVPMLMEHIGICASNAGVYGFNIGDTHNNWGKSLAYLYGKQNCSKKNAYRFVDWFLNHCGVEWLGWLIGNHDAWGDGYHVLQAMNVKEIPMEDWKASFKLCFPNDVEIKIDAAHGYKGRSMWNPSHGAAKHAMMRGDADIYVGGHIHTFGYQILEFERRISHILQLRGYKYIDEYAHRGGFDQNSSGAALFAVIDPRAETEAGRITVFNDPDQGVVFLKALRATSDG